MLAALVSLLLIFAPHHSTHPIHRPTHQMPPEVIADISRAEIRSYLTAQSQAVHAYWSVVAAVDASEGAERTREAQMVPVAPLAPQRATGGHSDAWWRGVAVCEQGGRNDPYYGYLSFMDGSMGGQPWSVQVAAGNALLASVGSESPAWAPACVAAGYAASPSG